MKQLFGLYSMDEQPRVMTQDGFPTEATGLIVEDEESGLIHNPSLQTNWRLLQERQLSHDSSLFTKQKFLPEKLSARLSHDSSLFVKQRFTSEQLLAAGFSHIASLDSCEPTEQGQSQPMSSISCTKLPQVSYIFLSPTLSEGGVASEPPNFSEESVILRASEASQYDNPSEEKLPEDSGPISCSLEASKDEESHPKVKLPEDSYSVPCAEPSQKDDPLSSDKLLEEPAAVCHPEPSKAEPDLEETLAEDNNICSPKPSGEDSKETELHSQPSKDIEPRIVASEVITVQSKPPGMLIDQSQSSSVIEPEIVPHAEEKISEDRLMVNALGPSKGSVNKLYSDEKLPQESVCYPVLSKDKVDEPHSDDSKSRELCSQSSKGTEPRKEASEVSTVQSKLPEMQIDRSQSSIAEPEIVPSEVDMAYIQAPDVDALLKAHSQKQGHGPSKPGLQANVPQLKPNEGLKPHLAPSPMASPYSSKEMRSMLVKPQLFGPSSKDSLIQHPSKEVRPGAAMKSSPAPSMMMKPSPAPSMMMKPSPAPSVMMKPSPAPSIMMKPTPAPSMMMKPSPAPSMMMKPSPAPSMMMKPSPAPSMMMKPSPAPSMMMKPSPAPSMMMKPSPAQSMMMKPSPAPSMMMKPSPVPSMMMKPSPVPSKGIKPGQNEQTGALMDTDNRKESELKRTQSRETKLESKTSKTSSNTNIRKTHHLKRSNESELHQDRSNEIKPTSKSSQALKLHQRGSSTDTVRTISHVPHETSSKEMKSPGKSGQKVFQHKSILKHGNRSNQGKPKSGIVPQQTSNHGIKLDQKASEVVKPKQKSSQEIKPNRKSSQNIKLDQKSSKVAKREKSGHRIKSFVGLGSKHRINSSAASNPSGSLAPEPSGRTLYQQAQSTSYYSPYQNPYSREDVTQHLLVSASDTRTAEPIEPKVQTGDRKHSSQSVRSPPLASSPLGESFSEGTLAALGYEEAEVAPASLKHSHDSVLSKIVE